MKSNLYVLTSSAIIGDENLQLKYLFYDCLVDSFKPRYINHSLLTFKTLQNFNDDYQNDFYGRDILSVIFPTQRYVILYTKKDLKMQEAAWGKNSLFNNIKNSMAKEHYLSFGQYISSIKEVINKIPSSQDKPLSGSGIRVNQDDDWRSFKSTLLRKKNRKIFFREEDQDDGYGGKVEGKFIFEFDEYFYALQGFYISYKWLWCNGPQMREKMQRLNKRAKQYGLTILQVPA